ncbi:MAG TPA: ferritin-like domain-containing protein [Thermoanaerobaculia bacterium]|nr:ferritin-like domain-containing protein [Thermoanaerobaculia bacterium]
MANSIDRKKVTALLNQILEAELAGVVRYTHYSFMVYGYNRIPIVSWLRDQANEGLAHAQLAGELLTSFGEHPSLAIGHLLETHKHDIGQILEEALANEKESLVLYRALLDEVRDRSVVLEEYARQQIAAEEQHAFEVDKMLRKPGEVGRFSG